jgi:hypothetical protein
MNFDFINNLLASGKRSSDLRALPLAVSLTRHIMRHVSPLIFLQIAAFGVNVRY